MADAAKQRFQVFVPGHPAPQGSKRHVGNGIMVESSKHVAPWRSDVRSACLDSAGKPLAFFDAAVHVELLFILKRPVSTPKSRTPPAIKKPDIDKLARAILDAIGSAGVWRDDSQVVALSAYKRLAMFGETPGCRIKIVGTADKWTCTQGAPCPNPKLCPHPEMCGHEPQGGAT